MTLVVLLGVVGLLCTSAIVSVSLIGAERIALRVGTAMTVFACAVGAAASSVALVRGDGGDLHLGAMPIGELHVALDGLSAFFLVCVFVVSGAASLYGGRYLREYLGKGRVAAALAFFALLVAAMAALVLARDAIVFLVAWEVMSLASFFLVTFEDERDDVRRAGMTYLIASQLGVVFLFVLFVLLSRGSGRYDFDSFAATGAPAGVCFILALVGFGTKAGLWPLHVWLPDAHSAAPSHVSAVMSGVMIKMGIYGLLRVVSFLGPPQTWWAGVMLAAGATSAIIAIAHANAQSDLKRRLAYSSVENIGVIALGIGLGLLGQALGKSALAFAGYAGALLHVLNHGLFKSLLFLGAGSVVHATGTRDMNALGGLGRRMPVTAACFFVGSAAISALPPLNGFVSEYLIYVAAFRGSVSLPSAWAVCALAVIAALALASGFVAACFVQAYGGVFLGQARTKAIDSAHDASGSMRAAMVGLAGACIVIGAWPSGALRIVEPAAAIVAHVGADSWIDLAPGLTAIARVTVVLVAAIVVFGALRRTLLRKRATPSVPTWGCGYAAPTARMQYSATSFSRPLLEPFSALTSTRIKRNGPAGFFPDKADYQVDLGDVAGERIIVPLAQRVIRELSRLHVIQQGRLNLYLVYIAVTLVALLFWQLGTTQ